MRDINATAVDLFAATVGGKPAGTWSAPGRVNLIGEHTDYNDGFVLPFAIDRRTVVAAAPRTDGTLSVTSTFGDGVVEVSLSALLGAIREGEVPGWGAYPLGVAWALGEFGADLRSVPGVDIVIDSSVPVGAGLSSSAAIESAVAIALNDLWQLDLSRPTLARVGQRAENDVVGAPTGIMDQSASLLGRRDSAVFLDCRSLDSELIELGFGNAGLAVLVIDTRVSHSHATGGYRDRREACESAARTLGVAALRDLGIDDLAGAESSLDPVTFRRVRHVVTENQRVLDTVDALRTSGPNGIGGFLTESHQSLRDDFEVSTPELDLAVDAAIAGGALGARMTGGGFGGSAIALVPELLVSEIVARVEADFSERGFKRPECFVVTPSDGALRHDAESAR